MKHWIMASRLRTLPAIAPVLLGWSICETKHTLVTIAALMGAILIQIATNFANDYFDFVNGADTEDRIGPTRATQARIDSTAPNEMGVHPYFWTHTSHHWLFDYSGWTTNCVDWGCLIASGILYIREVQNHLAIWDSGTFLFSSSLVRLQSRYRLCAEPYLDLEWNPTGCGVRIVIDNDSGRQQLKRSRDRCGRWKEYLAVRFGETFVRAEYTLCFVFTGAIIIYFGMERPWSFLALLTLLPSIPLQRSMWTESGRALDPNLGKTAKILVLFSIVFSLSWSIPV